MLASSVLVPPNTCENQYLPISLDVLLTFQNLNSSSEPESLPQPSPTLPVAPEGVERNAPIFAINEPVISPIEELVVVTVWFKVPVI